MGRLILLALFAVGCANQADVGGAPVWPDPVPVIPAFASNPVDCNQVADDMPEGRVARPQAFWADDPGLRETLTRVVNRLNTATALDLSVAVGGVEAIIVDLPPESAGVASDHIDIDVDQTGQAQETVLLHEVGHMLGAKHLGPWQGVMSRCTGNQSWLLTNADLEEICSGAPCATFQPENP